MSKVIFIVALALFLAGCVTHKDVVNASVFVRDDRTGMCFRVLRNSFGGIISMTWVPCTPEVVKEIERGGR